MSKPCFLFCVFVISGLAQERPVDIVFVLDDAPGTEQSIGLLNRRAFEKNDRVGVVTVTSGRVRMLQPLTADRELLARSLQKASTRVEIGFGGDAIAQPGNASLSIGLETAAEELRNHATASRRAILLLFISQDPDLPSRSEVIQSNLESANTRLYAVHIPAAQGRTPAIRLGGSRPLALPGRSADTILRDLAEATSGRLYLGPWDLRDVVKHLKTP